MEQSREFLFSWWWPLGIAGGTFLLGLLIDLIVLRALKKLAQKTPWEGDELIIRALRRHLPVWMLIIGLIVAAPFMPLAAKIATGIAKWLQFYLVIAVTAVGSRLAGDLIQVSTAGEAGPASTTIFKVLGRIGVWGLGIALALHTIGVSIAPVLTALGVGGLAVALALQDTLSNLFAGIQILLSKQVKVGDFVQVDAGREGFVTDINWRNTTIRALSNNLIIVPNSKMASSIAVNYNQPDAVLSVLVQMGVAYGSDLAKVEQVTIEIAREVMQRVEGGVPDHEPFIRFHTFSESSIDFTVILRGQQFTDQYLIKHEFMKRIVKRYREEGIEIPFPQRVVYQRSEQS